MKSSSIPCGTPPSSRTYLPTGNPFAPGWITKRERSTSRAASAEGNCMECALIIFKSRAGPWIAAAAIGRIDVYACNLPRRLLSRILHTVPHHHNMLSQIAAYTIMLPLPLYRLLLLYCLYIDCSMLHLDCSSHCILK